MGQARKDSRFKGVFGAFSDSSPNIFYEMDSVHIQKVFDLLTEKFGFPPKWLKRWNEHLEKQPRGADEIGIFLQFGNEHIDPILNALLLRSQSHGTFTKLCEYIILQGKRKNK